MIKYPIVSNIYLTRCINISYKSNYTLTSIRNISNKAWIKRHVDDFYVKEAKNNDLRSRSAFKFIELHDKHKIVKSVDDVIVDLGSTPGGWSIAVRNIIQELYNKKSKSKSKSKSKLKGKVNIKTNEMNINNTHQDNNRKDTGTGVDMDIDIVNNKSKGVTESIPNTNTNTNTVTNTITNNKFNIYAIDLLPMLAVDDVHFIHGNFLHKEIQKELINKIQIQKHGKDKKFNTIDTNTGIDTGPNDLYIIDVVLSDMLQNVSGNHAVDHARSIELVHEILHFSNIYLKKNGKILIKVLMGEDLKELVSEYIQPMFQKVSIIKPKASRTSSSEVYIYASGKI